MRIRLHSDDIAATASVTRGMLEGWRRGHLDGFSVMANGTALASLQEALAAEGARPAFVVAHLNLSEGPSTLPPAEVPLLVDARGELKHGYASLLRRWLFSRSKQRQALLLQIAQEWQAQIDQVRGAVAPRSIDGVDGHIHVHMLPFLFPIAARLARDNGIGTIRITQEPFHLARGLFEFTQAAMLINLIKHWVLRYCSWRARPLARQMGLQAPAQVLGVLYSGRMTAAAALAGVRAAQAKQAESLEAIFHIGRASTEECARWQDRQGIANFNLDPQRDLEAAELGEFHKALSQLGWRSSPEDLSA